MSNRVASKYAPVDWDARSLGDVVSRVTRRNDSGNANVLTISARDGLVNQEEFFNKRVASTDLSPYFLLTHGDFAYNKSYSIGYPVGVIRRLDRYPQGAVSPLYICFRPNPKLANSDYLAHYFQSGLLDDEISWIAKEGARNHGLLNVSVNDLLAIPIRVPSLAEQSHIAEILGTVEDVIWSTDQLIAKQTSLTAQLADELFTGLKRFNRGAKSAERPIGDWDYGRLPGVEKVPAGWRLVRLVEYARLESGHTPSRDVPGYWNGSVPWLSLHDTSTLNQHTIRATRYYVTMEGINNSSARLLPEGTVAFSRTATVGKCVILGRAMATSQDFACYICGPDVVNRYLLHLFRHMQSVWRSLASGSTHQTVYMPIFERLQVLLPPVAEQIRIADALDAADQALDSLRSVGAKQRNLKRGLMHDLLTGRVRVRDLS
jgi:type I restriction enzyme S subunit